MEMEPGNFKDLPAPLRIGLVLAAGGGLLAAIWVVTNELPPLARGKAVLGVTVGIMAVGLLLVFYAQIVKWRSARRTRPMEQQVLRSAGTGRQTISDPEQLARIDDLRKKFEEGIATFRAAGKSLYSLPWHVILGEPGSGKTEAIRHCGIGFPPGLHDRCQGVGGTINMNWWFTDHGVIIDTAGRLMFEEAGSGGTREWKEFLALMRKFRPNCPINGALLVIPCDSLIRDNADEIERKASQIAQQFDVIQRTLDVRFPVYVVVTKSDLINGFREFFDGLSDPQLQHQILGWSNPAEIDQPYDSHLVDTYLEEMKTRLFRARLARLGEVLACRAEDREQPAPDALYAFPHAFEQLGPRLKRYLDLIFSVGSQWSCKPLFFRGIYFTSSMQEGAALDEDLAAALGVPVESLPEGPVWKRDRAYFLRDLFTAKIFRESGLVTRATNARKLYARRRAAVLASAAVSLVLLIGLTVYGGFQYRRSVGTLQHVILPAAQEKEPLLILEPTRQRDDYVYQGERVLRNEAPLYAYFSDFATQAVDWGQSKGIPWLFRPAVQLKGIDDGLQQAARAVYRTGVLQPLVMAAMEKMPAQNDGTRAWTDEDAKVLRDLIALRGGRPVDRQSATALLDSLMRCARPQKAEPYEQHRTALADPLLRLYGDQPPYRDFDAAMLERIDKAIAAGVESFNAHWASPRMDRPELNAITEAVRCLTGTAVAGMPRETPNFADLEEQFIKKYAAIDPNGDPPERQLAEDLGRLESVKLRVDQARNSLASCPSLGQAWLSPVRKYLEDLDRGYAEIMAVFPNEVSDPNAPESSLTNQYQALQNGLTNCTQRFSDQSFRDRLAAVDGEFWADGLYDARFEMYRTAVECLGKLRGIRIVDLTSLCEAVQTGRRLVGQDQGQLQSLLKQHAQRHRVEDGHRTAAAILRSGDRRLCREAVRWWLDNMPPDASALDRHVEKKSGERYDPTATAEVFSAWDGLNRDCQIDQMPAEIRNRLRRVSAEYARYARAYVDHCLTVRGQELLRRDLPQAEDWRAYHKELSRSSVPDILKALDASGRQLKGYLAPVENCAHGSEMAAKFDEKWASLHNSFDQMKYREVLNEWRALSEEPLAARTTLLACKPNELRQRYVVSLSDPPMASPDSYWHMLAVTGLELLVAEVDRACRQEVEAIKTCSAKFPLNRFSNEDLTVEDADRIHRFADRFAAGTYSPGTVGAGAKTEIREIDDLIVRLRDAAKPPAWIRSADALLPRGDVYRCRLCEIKTTPPRQVRKVYLMMTTGGVPAEGPLGKSVIHSITWDDLRSYPEGIGMLNYDGSNNALQLNFMQYINSNEVPVEAPKVYRGPWAWHRMLENHEFEKDSGTYIIRYRVSAEGDLRPVTVEVRLRFFKERDGSGSPIEMFVSAP